VRLLLDTHVLLWWMADDPALSAASRVAIAAAENLIVVSAASIWEIRTKQAIGKLDLPSEFADVLSRQAFEPLSVTIAHAHGLCDLPLLHRDPFDRLLVAQARVEGLTIVTRDHAIMQYDVPTFPA
jgi:PIN domain nuclease of toxin-antitoxin system